MDGVCLLVWDLNAEFLFNQLVSRHTLSARIEGTKSIYLLNCHHNLNGIQTVQSEIVCEVRSSVDLWKKTGV